VNNRLNELSRKLLKPRGTDCTRGSSRSSSKGRITGKCPECKEQLIIVHVDRFNTQTECRGCGLIEDLGVQTLSQSGK
jgi:hypothetical protein